MKHYYTARGSLVSPNTPRAMPSVTTILDVMDNPELNAWRLRVGPDQAEARRKSSSERGTAIHQLVSDWIDNRPVEAYNKDHERALHGYINWADKVKPTEIRSEVFLYSKRYRYAGTADIVCRINGELWLIDLKTGSSIKRSYGLQLRAYEQCLYERYKEHARIGILRTTSSNKSGYQFKELDEPLEVFIACKTLYDWQQKHSKESEFDGRYLTRP